MKNLRVHLKVVAIVTLLWVDIYILLSYALSSREFADVFLYSDSYAVLKILNSGRLYMRETVYAYHPFYDFILYTISIFSRKPPELAILLPIGLFVLPVVYLVVSKDIFNITSLKKELYAYLIFASSYFSMLYLTVDGSLTPELYNTFAYVWSYALYLSSLLLLLLFVKYKRYKYLVLLPVIYATLVNVHYTSPLWLIISMALLLGLSLPLQGKRLSSKIGVIFVIYTTIYLTFNRIFYDVFLYSLVSPTQEEPLVDPIKRFFDKVSGFVFGERVIASKPEFYAPPYSPPLFGRIRVTLYLSIFLSVFILISYILLRRKTFRRYYESLSGSQKLILLWIYSSFVVIFLFDSLGYSIVGTYSTKYLLLMGPLVMILSLLLIYQLVEFNRQKSGNLLRIAILGFLSAITILNAISLGIHISSMAPLGYSQVYPSAKFFYAHLSKNNPVVLTDMRTYCMYLPEAARNNVRLRQRFINNAYYKLLVSDNGGYSFDYFITSPKYKYLLAERWTTYKPISYYSADMLSKNTRINLVYNDGAIWIFYVSKR